MQPAVNTKELRDVLNRSIVIDGGDNMQLEKQSDKTDLSDTGEIDDIFNEMLIQEYGKSLEEMLALAELARWYDARPFSQLTMEQKMYLFGGRARITCTKCGRTFFEPILQPWVQRPDGKVMLCLPVDVYGCSQCMSTTPQPKEGDTFHRERRKGRGKLLTVGRGDRGHRDTLTYDGDSIKVSRTRDMTDESLTKDALMSWASQEQIQQNIESQIREQLLTPGNITAAEIALRQKTVRDIQRCWKPDLPYSQVRFYRGCEVSRPGIGST